MANPLASSIVDDYSFTPAEPFRVVVEEGKIHEFARATRSRCDEHLRPLNPISPVTFLASAALWMAEENSAWRGVTRDFANTLHGEQQFVFHGPPPPAGSELAARQVVDRSYQKQGRRGGSMTFTEVVTRFWTRSEDDPVVEMRSISIRKHPAALGSAGNHPTAPSTAGVVTNQVDPLKAFVDRPLTVTDFVRYQGASGDFNPIHHDTAFAQASDYPGPFAVGMLTASIAANYLTDQYGAAAVRRFGVRFQSQGWPGDVMTYQGFRSPAGDPHDVRVRVSRPNGEVHLDAWADLIADAG